MTTGELKKFADQRRHIRLKSLFPVEFHLKETGEGAPLIGKVNGCTYNVSQGGIVVETSNVSEEDIEFIRERALHINLQVKVPIKAHPVETVCQIVWHKKHKVGKHSDLLIGMRFESVSEADLTRLIKRANGLNVLFRIIILLSILLFISLIVIRFYF